MKNCAGKAIDFGDDDAIVCHYWNRVIHLGENTVFCASSSDFFLIVGAEKNFSIESRKCTRVMKNDAKFPDAEGSKLSCKNDTRQ